MKNQANKVIQLRSAREGKAALEEAVFEELEPRLPLLFERMERLEGEVRSSKQQTSIVFYILCSSFWSFIFFIAHQKYPFNDYRFYLSLLWAGILGGIWLYTPFKYLLRLEGCITQFIKTYLSAFITGTLATLLMLIILVS